MTLDDLTRRINEICSENVETARAAKLQFDMSVEALAKAVDASPDLDKSAAASIVMGRVNRMVSELSGAVN